jgi:hypothetical protein
MNIYLSNAQNFSYPINLLSEKLPKSALSIKVAIVALAILCAVIVYHFFSSSFHIKAKVIDSPNSEENVKGTQQAQVDLKLQQQKKKVEDFSPIKEEGDQATKPLSAESSIRAEEIKTASKDSAEVQKSVKSKATKAEIPKTKGQTKRKKLRKHQVHSTINKAPPLTAKMPQGKAKALEEYKKNPETCIAKHKRIIFTDIKGIEYQDLARTNKKEKDILYRKEDLITVIDLMLHLSGLTEVDLNHRLCASVVGDVLRECNKETSERLCVWLSKEKTFNIPLLKACIQVFIDKQVQSLPFNLYSVELLMKIYKEKEWNKLKHKDDSLILPSNDPRIVSAMTILIKGTPNENRIISLAEWMIDQPQYDLDTFSKWLRIFQQKEQENKAINLYYPLLDQLIDHFKNRWGKNFVNSVDADVRNYLLSKINN